MKRLSVLFLAPPPELRHPWVDDVITALNPLHKLSVFDVALPLEPQFGNVDVVIDHGGSMGTRAMADAAHSVQLWQLSGNGIDHFELEYWRAKGIQVANCPGELTGVPLAELVILFMLQLSRGWHESQKNLRASVSYPPFGTELGGRTLGLVGFGATARQLAARASAFGMRTIGIDIRDVSAAEQAKFGVSWVRGPNYLDELLAESDFVSLHLHLTPDTRHTIDARRLALMKPGAFLINVSRGELVDESALVAALRSRQLAGAGLDVFCKEPPGPDHPLLAFDNVVATPHIAGQTYGTSKRRAAFVAENIDRLARGETPLALIGKRDNVAEFRDHSQVLRSLRLPASS
jgi:phosphoglycerate dehydrogenase-like enzyme